MAEYLLVIDGSSLLSTQYYGNMPNSIKFESDEEKRKQMYDQLLKTSTGIYTNGVFGFFRTLFNILREQKPTHLAIAWDEGRDTFRKEISSEYKATRKTSPEPLRQQFITCRDICEQLGIIQFVNPKYEADDFCGSIAKKFEDTLPIRILTKDKDYFQLISSKTHIWLLMNNGKDLKEKIMSLFDKYHMDPRKYNFPNNTFRINETVLKGEYGYTSEVAVMVKAIQGDSSDNIKGIPGVGPEVAIALANEYKTIENLYNTIENLDKEKEQKLKEHWKTLGINRSPLKSLLKESDDPNIIVGKEAAIQSEQLGKIKTDINLDDYFFFGAELSEFKIKIDSVLSKEVLLKYEIKTINTNY